MDTLGRRRFGWLALMWIGIVLGAVALAPATTFLSEGFEAPFVNGAPPGWTRAFKTGTVDWARRSGDGQISGAHGGTYNAWLYYGASSSHETYLISPAINLAGTTNATLEFWHKQTAWGSDQDTLIVYYKTSSGGTWTQLAAYTSNVSSWTQRTIALPNVSATYYIGFLGNARYGRGVCIDDVAVTATSGTPAPTITGITPTWGATGTSVSVTNLAGTGFQSGAVVSLRKDGQSIDGTGVTLVSSSQIMCTFNLANAALGQWDVVVTNSDGQSGSLAAGFTVTTSLPNVIFVSLSGNDATDGRSWGQAKRTVQAALDAATAGYQVWVKTGIYNERVTLKPGVALYGGFNGTESTLADRNWIANETTLDGNGSPGSSVVTAPSNGTLSTRIDGFTISRGTGTLSGNYRLGGGIYCNASSSDLTIANNKITNNTATGSAGGYGGGIYCSNASPQIQNNTISNNRIGFGYSGGGGIGCFNSSATITGNTITGNNIMDSSLSDGGGGIYCKTSSATIANNAITGNTAPSGGAIGYVSSSGSISCNTITDNSADYGAGIHCDNASPLIEGNTIGSNSAYEGGGIYCTDESAPAIRNNTIEQNTADSRGAGIRCLGWSDISDNTITGNAAGWYGGGICADTGGPSIRNNRITGNSSDNGGGIYCSSATIADNTIDGNTASLGGGIHCSSSFTTITNNTITTNTGNGGGIYCSSCSPTISRNTIADNSSAYSGEGGGIYCLRSSPLIANNLFIGNAGDNGGAVSCAISSPTVVGNIISGNVSAYTGGGIYCRSFSSPNIVNNTVVGNTAKWGGGIGSQSCSPSIVNTIIASNSSGVFASGSPLPSVRSCCAYANTAYNYLGLVPDPADLNGNISVDPRLAAFCYGDMHIQPESLCVDAGDDTVVQAGWVDMDGQARKQGAHVDMGADESDGGGHSSAPALVLRVSQDSGSSDANNGLSWTSAKRTVQAAINAVAPIGGEVWVKKGTYAERITLRTYVHVYGGFAGVETQRSSRNWSKYRTELDGGSGGSVVSAWRIGYQLATIDGFTIQNGVSGISFGMASATIRNNTIRGNTASWGGGGVYSVSSFGSIMNNIIHSNSAPSYGGGIYSSGSVLAANNTIVGNRAPSGGGVYCTSSSPTITNTIVACNSSGIAGTAEILPVLQGNCVHGNAAYNYSGLTDPTGTEGNISADPLFASASPGADGIWGTTDDTFTDLHLLSGSPCINAGDPAYVPADGETDLDGQPRKIGTSVDIGADEFCWAGDINFDSYVNVGDLQALVTAWGTQKGEPGYSPAADVSGDTYVNVSDLQMLVANWAKGI